MKNILLLICDQLSFRALKAYGNAYSNTPNIDTLAERGIVFDRAYTNCPLCQPARASFWSSSYPHENEVISNLPKQVRETFPEDITTLGEVFQEAGYACVHFGKEHDYGALRGFERVIGEKKKVEPPVLEIPYQYETFLDKDTTEKAVNYLEKEVAKLKNPFLTVVDLQNPHNICGYIGEHDNKEADFVKESELPDLPDNFMDKDWQTRASYYRYLCCAHRRQSQTTSWGKREFQHYLYAYYHYLSIVDAQIGEILTALKKSGKEKDTLVVFFSDHGEGMAAHKIVTKSGTFYEETARVPFVLSGGALERDIAQKRELPCRFSSVTSLLDLLPTLADYAGIRMPESAGGVSRWPEINGLPEKDGNYAVSQWYDEFEGYYVPARMYVEGQYKYIVYQEKQGIEEELYNLREDPLEQKNLAVFSEYQGVLQDYRQKFRSYTLQTKDPFYTLKADYSEEYRKHPAQEHKGKNAVLEYQKKLDAEKDKKIRKNTCN